MHAWRHGDEPTSTQMPRMGEKPMNNNMTAMSYQDFPRLKKQKPFSLEEERANALTVGKAEIGLLDIVILDAIAENEACQY
jgi:hypothetical protein